jgi:hypothetical protein
MVIAVAVVSAPATRDTNVLFDPSRQEPDINATFVLISQRLWPVTGWSSAAGRRDACA